MAELHVDGDELVLALTPFEHAEALHGDIRVPVAAITAVEVVDDALHEVHGLRAPGTGIPGEVVVATMHDRGSRVFVVVHHGHPRGVRVRLTGAGFDALLVGLPDPEAVATAIDAARGAR